MVEPQSLEAADEEYTEVSELLEALVRLGIEDEDQPGWRLSRFAGMCPVSLVDSELMKRYVVVYVTVCARVLVVRTSRYRS